MSDLRFWQVWGVHPDEDKEDVLLAEFSQAPLAREWMELVEDEELEHLPRLASGCDLVLVQRRG